MPKRRAARSAASTAYTHESRIHQAGRSYGEKKLRFNWNTPIHMSPNEKGTIYIGAQFLFRSRDHGQSWDRISPDLTTNDPEKQKQEESGGVTCRQFVGGDAHHDLFDFRIAANGQVIWVGTDDGNVQITRDGANTGPNVTGNMPGPGKPPGFPGWKPSRFDEDTAYATVRPPHVWRHEAATSTRPPTTARAGPLLPQSKAACAATRT
jgi:hypothetical protein